MNHMPAEQHGSCRRPTVYSTGLWKLRADTLRLCKHGEFTATPAWQNIRSEEAQLRRLESRGCTELTCGGRCAGAHPGEAVPGVVSHPGEAEGAAGQVWQRPARAPAQQGHGPGARARAGTAEVKILASVQKSPTGFTHARTAQTALASPGVQQHLWQGLSMTVKHSANIEPVKGSLGSRSIHVQGMWYTGKRMPKSGQSRVPSFTHDS